jgi:signal peptidase I
VCSSDLSRGDVVVFEDPGGWLDPSDTASTNPLTSVLTRIGLYPAGGHLVKRVIGVPGDVVECCTPEGQLIVNGHPIDESAYALPGGHACAPGQESGGQCYGPMPGVAHWQVGPVPAGQLFVMGDNRAHSADSSYHLCTELETDCSDSPWVSQGLVVGKVAALMWPLDKARLERRPEVFTEALDPS